MPIERFHECGFSECKNGRCKTDDDRHRATCGRWPELSLRSRRPRISPCVSGLDGRVPADSLHQPRGFPATAIDENGDLIVFRGITMPIHDWIRLEPGDFHHFHQTWITYLGDALNGGGLPPGFMALSERVMDESQSSRLSRVYSKRKRLRHDSPRPWPRGRDHRVSAAGV